MGRFGAHHGSEIVRLCTRIALLLLLGFNVSLGQTAEESPSRAPLFEIAPFIGLRAGGQFDLDTAPQNVNLDDASSFALALNLRMDEASLYEFFYSRQSTNLERGSPLGNVDVDVEYLHIGGIAEWRDENRVIPYVVGGLGMTRFHPDPAAARDDTRFSVSLGAGVRVPMSERFSLRFEGRGYLTFVDANTAFFCRSDQNGALCRLHGSGSTFIQYELLAGAAFAF